MLSSAFPSVTSNTRGDLAFRALLLSLMTIKPKPRCRVRGVVEEMGAILRGLLWLWLGTRHRHSYRTWLGLELLAYGSVRSAARGPSA